MESRKEYEMSTDSSETSDDDFDDDVTFEDILREVWNTTVCSQKSNKDDSSSSDGDDVDMIESFAARDTEGENTPKKRPKDSDHVKKEKKVKILAGTHESQRMTKPTKISGMSDEWPTPRFGCLERKKFRLTGNLETISQHAFKNYIIANGGRAACVNPFPSLDFLVVGKNPSRRWMEVAKVARIKQMNEAQFLAFMKAATKGDLKFPKSKKPNKNRKLTPEYINRFFRLKHHFRIRKRNFIVTGNIGWNKTIFAATIYRHEGFLLPINTPYRIDYVVVGKDFDREVVNEAGAKGIPCLWEGDGNSDFTELADKEEKWLQEHEAKMDRMEKLKRDVASFEYWFEKLKPRYKRVNAWKANKLEKKRLAKEAKEAEELAKKKRMTPEFVDDDTTSSDDEATPSAAEIVARDVTLGQEASSTVAEVTSENADVASAATDQTLIRSQE